VHALETLTRKSGAVDIASVARGTVAGVAEWLAIRLGPRAAYDLLQHAADDIITKVQGGTIDDQAPKQQGKPIE
jgi:hypothetical protein